MPGEIVLLLTEMDGEGTGWGTLLRVSGVSAVCWTSRWRCQWQFGAHLLSSEERLGLERQFRPVMANL